MGQLYTVRLVAKRLVSYYDSRGRLLSEKEELIPQVYHDLPFKTALAYKTNFPDAKVEIVMQAIEAPTHSSSSPTRGTSGKRPNKIVKDDVDDEIVTEKDFSAAQTGDMAAAINAEINQ